MLALDPVALHVGIIARDPDVLADFERSMRPLVVGWLRAKGVQGADADEIWNEAFLAVIDSAPRLVPMGSALRPFTMRVAHNVWVSRVRQAKRRDEIALEAASDVETSNKPGHKLTVAQTGRLQRCLEDARPTYRSVVEFSARGLATDEIATILQLTKANVQKLRQRGYAWFKGCLEGIFDAPSA